MVETGGVALYTEIGTKEKTTGTRNDPVERPGNDKEEWLRMIICHDCGRKNLASLYCERCGADLYARNRRPERTRESIFDRPLVLR